MSIVAEHGTARAAVPAPPRPSSPVRTVRVRRVESLRPPTRARVVAGRRVAGQSCVAPKRAQVRWPWLAALAVGSCLVVVVLGLYGGGTPGAAVPPATATVSVQPGDTLNGLAARFAPGADPDAVVARIKQLNQLDDAVLLPGEALVVPASAGRS